MTESTKRIFYKSFDEVPFGKFEDLGYTIGQLQNMTQHIDDMTLTEFRNFINVLIKEGPIFSKETPTGELLTLQKEMQSFLAKGRKEQMREELKEKRLPKH